MISTNGRYAIRVLIDLAEGGGTINDTQEAAMKVIYKALTIIIVGGVINNFIKKKKIEAAEKLLMYENI